MTRGWEDRRLEAAFAARAASATRPTADLADLTVKRLRRESRPRSTIIRLGGFAGLAAALAVVVIAVIGIGFRDRGPLASVSPLASVGLPGTATSGSAGSPGPSAGPASLPTMSVGAAIELRDASSESGEIRVAGWLRGGVPVPCPAPMPPFNPTQLWCPQALPWIVESVPDSGVGRLNEAPSGPAIQPSFALVDADRLPSLMFGSAPPAAPVEITVTGHFHDRRATLCSSAGDCWGTFVVDRIDSVGGIAQPVTTSYDLAIQTEKGTTTSGREIPLLGAAEQFDSAVMSQGHRLAVLSRRVMSIDALLDAEPALATGWAGVGTATTVASITAVETEEGSGPPHPRTFLVPNGSAFLYEMTDTGPVVAANLPVQVYPGGLVGRVGEPVTVSQAIDHRDHALDATELLVSGFAWAPGVIACPAIEPSMPVLEQCPSTFTWLAERRPRAGGGDHLTQPDGPALNLVIPPESVNLALLTVRPTAVVVLGHFDDHRSATCPPGTLERCRQNFIVDTILDPRRLALDPDLALSVHPGPSNVPRGTAAWAARVAGLSEADRADRLISAFPVAVAALSAFEADTLGTEAASRNETVWLVHFLDTGVGGFPIVRTRMVIDASPDQRPAGVFDITDAGVSRALAANP